MTTVGHAELWARCAMSSSSENSAVGCVYAFPQWYDPMRSELVGGDHPRPVTEPLARLFLVVSPRSAILIDQTSFQDQMSILIGKISRSRLQLLRRFRAPFRLRSRGSCLRNYGSQQSRWPSLGGCSCNFLWFCSRRRIFHWWNLWWNVERLGCSV